MVSKPVRMGKEEPAMDVTVQSDEKPITAVEQGGDENDSNEEKETLLKPEPDPEPQEVEVDGKTQVY